MTRVCGILGCCTKGSHWTGIESNIGADETFFKKKLQLMLMCQISSNGYALKWQPMDFLKEKYFSNPYIFFGYVYCLIGTLY